MSELGSDDAVAAVGSDDSAPDSSISAVLALSLCFPDQNDFLA